MVLDATAAGCHKVNFQIGTNTDTRQWDIYVRRSRFILFVENPMTKKPIGQTVPLWTRGPGRSPWMFAILHSFHGKHCQLWFSNVDHNNHSLTYLLPDVGLKLLNLTYKLPFSHSLVRLTIQRLHQESSKHVLHLLHADWTGHDRANRPGNVRIKVLRIGIPKSRVIILSFSSVSPTINIAESAVNTACTTDFVSVSSD